jgi:stearoyl-CoA desaturase (delta-9 desaturase)
MCFGLPALIGWFWGGAQAALGAFILAGVGRVVMVQHFTFFINSFCHMIGRQPYTNQNTARDSALMALFTYGEGYHNYHHQFQHDYRNGVKPWQFDPTKWCIWLLNRAGLTSDLRRVPAEKIMMAEITEQQRRLALKLDTKSIHLPESVQHLLHSAQERLHQSFSHWEVQKAEYMKVVESQMAASRKRMKELREEVRQATDHFREAIKEWKNAHQLALAQLA